MRKLSTTVISFVLFAFERLAYLEILGVEYMAFCPENVDDEYEEMDKEKEMKEKDE